MRTAAAFSRHDHAQCASQAVSRARRLCRDRGVRLTPQRQMVLELLWRSHQPIGAYALLDMLREARGCDAPPAPPTVYRALDFLVAQGLAHRLQTLNAYIGCPRPEHDHQGQFLICSRCHNAVEVFTRHVQQALSECASSHAFKIENETVELIGVCASCRSGH